MTGVQTCALPIWLFGRGANYCAEDITRITYGKKTLYETPPIQAEDMAERIEMGGMQLG